MTRFLTLRTHDVGGAVQFPQAVDCDVAAAPLSYRPVADADIRRWVAGRDLVLAIHGFNVSRPSGAGSLGALEAYLALPANYRFFGVLWPGDFWLPVVNYPWEAGQAVTAGRKIATYANDVFAGAASISFISHSLGARVLLEAVKNLDREAAQLCITAGAIDDNCLNAEYLKARENAARSSVLSSLADRVLQLAYPAGGAVADILLGAGDSPWDAALGRTGPKPPFRPPVFEEPIPPALGYDHGDYLPPSDIAAAIPPSPGAKWPTAADYMKRAVTGLPNLWP